MKRFQIIAPNGSRCSAIWASEGKEMLQTWSAKRKQWESFPALSCAIDENCVLDMATKENPIINNAGNKIEFKNGTTFAKDFHTNKFRRVNNFML